MKCLYKFVAFGVSVVVFAGSFAQQPASSEGTPAAQTPAVGVSGDSVYATAKPRLLQIRTLLKSTSNQSSIGSGFLVSEQGLIVTNYHVISQAALEPSTYRLEYAATDASAGALELLAFDIVNDLAVVRMVGADVAARAKSFFQISPRAKLQDSQGGLQKGERLYAMGNPLDLGFTIVEGTYNSLVAKSYNDRIHFSGAINAGMSGGPVVDAQGLVVGINVAKRLDGDLVSFLVPAKFAVKLLARAPSVAMSDAKATREEIGRQLLAYQAQFVKDLRSPQSAPLIKKKTSKLGSFQIVERDVPWLSCWARSNAEAKPKPRFLSSSNSCGANADIFLAGDWFTGQYRYGHAIFINEDLSALQFPYVLRESMRIGNERPKRYTAPQCTQQFLNELGPKISQRVTICSRAYRDIESIYDFSVALISQNGTKDALVSEMRVQGVSWDNGLLMVGDFIKSVQAP